MSGQLRAAVAPYEESLVALAAEDRYTATLTRCLLGTLHQSLGDWDAATRAYAQVRAQADQIVHGVPTCLPTAGWALIGLGDMAYARDNLDLAEQQLVERVSLAEQGALRDALPFGYAALTLLRLAQGQGDAARATSETMTRFAAQELHLPLVIEWSGAVAARVALAQDDLAAATRWTQRSTPPPAALFPSQACALMTFLRVQLRMGPASASLHLVAGPSIARPSALRLYRRVDSAC
ncbi:hypothetical protein K2Z83_26000 [Oscillochloris sp. ZM17-4]|uniref:hypothetical protein n=1 Tax=Oscillochloris sp. ZM17-4 TaxID=2866714 RepID=UPI001C72A00E|nr:hypothetical protein [Oscillochloris sp. ZM17-4]MBX0331106.1 hypothetical protein [Oscillochloris sp. ZM17-4]